MPPAAICISNSISSGVIRGDQRSGSIRPENEGRWALYPDRYNLQQ